VAHDLDRHQDTKRYKPGGADDFVPLSVLLVLQPAYEQTPPAC